MGQCQGTSWNCRGRHGKEKQAAVVNAPRMSVQATMANTGSGLVSLAVPTWSSLQVFAIVELLSLPVPYMKLASPFLFCLFLFKLALLIWCQLPLQNNGSEVIFGQVFFLREEFAKASCSFMEDGDYEEGEKITIKYSLKRKFKVFL